MRFDALNRLWERVRESSHDFRATTEVFPNLDVQRVAKDLDLAKKGAERGAQNEPPSDAAALDEVEIAVAERIEQEKKTAHQSLEDQTQTFSERLTNLDFEGQFAMIRQANATTVTDYVAEWQKGIDELHGLRRALDGAERERSSFQLKHKLDREPRLQPPAMKVLKILFLIACVLFEAWFNGSFLAAGSEQGLIGGITLATGFAALNIGSAVLAAFLVKFSLHRSFFKKLLGVLIFPVYLGFAALINLALAHYRETSETLFGEAGREVVRRLSTSPFDLNDVQSWILFGVGVSFSIAAFIDAWALADPYPGYAGVESRLQKARQRYVEARRELIEDLRDVRDEYAKKIEDIIRDLSIRKREYDAIVGHRARLMQLFEQHQSQLELAANTLITLYRESNRKARSAPPPGYFIEPYRVQRIQLPPRLIGELNDEELAGSVRAAREELSLQAQRIADEFGKAIEQYDNLDKLHPGMTHGKAQA